MTDLIIIGVASLAGVLTVVGGLRGLTILLNREKAGDPALQKALDDVLAYAEKYSYSVHCKPRSFAALEKAIRERA